MKGYDELRTGAAWLNLNGRGKIRMTGEDRARLLHAMTTNHIQQLQPGRGCYAFFLNAQGRILGDVNVLCRPDSFLLDTEPETKDKLHGHLDAFIIADDVALEDLTPAMATIALEGPRASEVLRAVAAPVPESPYDNLEWGSRLVAKLSYTGSDGFFILAPDQEGDALIAALESAGAVAADLAAFETVRLEHGRPRYGPDISERYLAQEANQMHALHFQKGCYLGQEIVERVRSRAQIHRRLHPVLIETDRVPEPGTKLTAGEKPAAEITSAAFSPALGKVAALAYVRIEFERPGTELRWEGFRAIVGADPPAPRPESPGSR